VSVFFNGAPAFWPRRCLLSLSSRGSTCDGVCLLLLPVVLAIHAVAISHMIFAASCALFLLRPTTCCSPCFHDLGQRHFAFSYLVAVRSMLNARALRASSMEVQPASAVLSPAVLSSEISSSSSNTPKAKDLKGRSDGGARDPRALTGYCKWVVAWAGTYVGLLRDMAACRTRDADRGSQNWHSQ
jgi:hypothetical protein